MLVSTLGIEPVSIVKKLLLMRKNLLVLVAKKLLVLRKTC